MENENDIENINELNFKIFCVFINLYSFSKIFENKIKQTMQIKEEYFFIDSKGLDDLKKNFFYSELEQFFELHNLSKFKDNLDDKELFDLYQKSKYNNKILKEEEFNKYNRIINENITVKNDEFHFYKDFSLINLKTLDKMRKNNFYFDQNPKADIYIGNQNFIISLSSSELECIFCKDYDCFTDEYIIKYINSDYKNNAIKDITENGLQYYFNINKIDTNNYKPQIIYDSKISGNKIATVNSINSNKKKEIIESLNETIKNCYIEALNDSLKNAKRGENGELDAVGQIMENITETMKNNNNKIFLNDKINLKLEDIKYQTIVFKTILPKDGTIFFQNFDPDKRIGLVNFGNSCYINVVLQCLVNIPELVKFFFLQNKIPINLFQKPLSYALCLLANGLYRPINNNNNIITKYKPEFICNIIYNLNNNFTPTKPNDAKDLLIYIIERLHQELNENDPNQTNYYNIVESNDPLSHFVCYFTSNYNSIISNLFNWMMQVKRTCDNCKGQILNYQTYPYLILDLENTRRLVFEANHDKTIKSNKKIDNYENWVNEYYEEKENIPIDLIDCINFFNSKKVDFNFFCPYCNQFCKQISTNRIYSSPNIFIFILNRGKNNIHSVKMNYPPKLDLSDYIESNVCPKVYELIGVITHLGVSGPGGHFIAFCKSPLNDKWYRYNDDKVNEAEKFNIHNEGIAYILFYRYKK